MFFINDIIANQNMKTSNPEKRAVIFFKSGENFGRNDNFNSFYKQPKVLPKNRSKLKMIKGLIMKEGESVEVSTKAPEKGRDESREGWVELEDNNFRSSEVSEGSKKKLDGLGGHLENLQTTLEDSQYSLQGPHRPSEIPKEKSIFTAVIQSLLSTRNEVMRSEAISDSQSSDPNDGFFLQNTLTPSESPDFKEDYSSEHFIPSESTDYNTHFMSSESTTDTTFISYKDFQTILTTVKPDISVSEFNWTDFTFSTAKPYLGGKKHF